MSKYYNEYQSQKSKTGRRIATALIVIALVTAAALSIAFIILPKIAGLKGGQTATPPTGGTQEPTPAPELTVLSAPYNIILDVTQTKLSWKCSDSTKSIGYRIKINDEEYTVYTNPVDINLAENEEAQIRIKALGDNISYSDSVWSAVFTVYKQEAEFIAYQMIHLSMKTVLEANVKVYYGGANRAITVTDIFAIDYGSSTGKVWYSYKVQDAQGLACTTVSLPSISGIIDYKNKLSQATAIINNNDINTKAMTFAQDDYTAALLAREDLTGSLANYKHQNSILMPICQYTSTVTTANGQAVINFVGIICRERANGTINFYTYNYTASTPIVAGYTTEDYFRAFAGNELPFTYTQQPSAEINGLGKEMLIMYVQHKEE